MTTTTIAISYMLLSTFAVGATNENAQCSAERFSRFDKIDAKASLYVDVVVLHVEDFQAIFSEEK